MSHTGAIRCGPPEPFTTAGVRPSMVLRAWRLASVGILIPLCAVAQEIPTPSDLTARLGSSSPAVVAWAAFQAGTFQVKEVVPSLVAALESPPTGSLEERDYAAAAILDALIQIRSVRGEPRGPQAPATAVAPSFDRWPIQTLILGSYLVNGPGDCVGCHTNGLFAAGGDPFVGQPTIINTAIYLGGGRAFGPFISRNLTPDDNGRPAGLTLEEFELTIRTGTDLKGLAPHVPSFPCLLQVMPWPQHRYWTDQYLRAIYEYLSAIPCKEGGPGLPPNRC